MSGEEGADECPDQGRELGMDRRFSLHTYRDIPNRLVPRIVGKYYLYLSNSGEVCWFREETQG